MKDASLLDPSFVCNRIYIRVVVFIAICVNLPVLKKECSLIESVFIWK
jgi:hypothetical protein